ncbi:MAG: glycoside hydrolase family 2 TIM barrel-domain containing protein [Eubacteriales bacterium]|nr:glycoside hydrolase family 2 TIM barrel-domain containing protein [Eubacteriales bacterium]
MRTCDSTEWKKWMDTPVPRLAPAPVWCVGTRKAVCSLSGEWQITDRKDGKRLSVQVPHDTEILRRTEGLSRHYEYRREILLPEQAAGMRLLLRFDSVNGFAKVSIDGEPVGEHQNGFLAWNIDITDCVRGKSRFVLTVAMDEESDEVSAYSHGGILRDVWLYLLPQTYVSALYLSPLFDEDRERCTLRVDLDLSVPGRRPGCGAVPERETDVAADHDGVSAAGAAADHDRISAVEASAPQALFLLRAPDGNVVCRKRVCLDNRIDGYYTVMLPVEDAVLWDAEHPFLYEAEITLYDGEEKQEVVRKKIGLRQLERKGNRVFVNGQEIKLRGVCRHEIAPHRGRSLTREWIEKDVALFKEANCNYIRTSHYPPSEYFLELCDEKGIYVEDELALAFIARSLPYTQRDPEQAQRYLSHFTEILARDYNHPSVIIWSLCNESFGGYNFDLLNRYAHRKDPTRMTKFSYPMTIREEHEMPDVWSIHYSEYDTDLGKKRDNVSVGHAPGRDMPVLHDEYIHVACYNREELRRDPSLRSFWGESARIFWDRIWHTEGAFGGAIWAGIDETDLYDGGNTRLEWGIIDVWRRKKPEFYLTRKAYSPVKLLHSEWIGAENKVILVLENRFCHTDLSEVRLDWRIGERQGSAFLPSARPKEPVRAVIELPQEAMGAGESFFATLWDACGKCVDEWELRERGEQLPSLMEAGAEQIKSAPSSLRTNSTARELEISGSEFSVVFSKKTGLLTELRAGRKLLVTGGPFLNAPYLKLGEWESRSFGWDREGEDIVVESAGSYGKEVALTWRFVIRPDGSMDVSYRIDRMDKALPKQIKLRVGVDCGGLDELGIAFVTIPEMDRFTFRRVVNPDREGWVSWYPEDHISRNQGTALRYGVTRAWGEEPRNPWGTDAGSDILNGRYDPVYTGTPDFCSTKEDVAEGILWQEGEQGRLAVLAVPENPSHVRLEAVDPKESKIPESDPRIRYTGTWYSVRDVKESDHGTEHWSREAGASAECTFTGTGIVWYGPQDTTFGMANVYLDGKKVAERISQRVAGVDFSCSSVGYDKKYHLPIFSAQNLPFGEHTIRIEVCGEKAQDASDCYIVLDYLRVLGEKEDAPVRININQAYAFPHISWGNYRKPPILLREGDTGKVRLQALSGRNE